MRNNRKFLLTQIRNPISKIQLISFHSRRSKILVLLWRDKRIITMLSSYDTGSMITTSRVTLGVNQIDITKPQVALNYNNFMGEVDQMGSLCFFTKIIKMMEEGFFVRN